MIKICKKKDCNNTAIARGKYCNIHRTNKAKNNIPILREETKQETKYNNDEDIELALKLSLETLKIEKTNKIEEDRKLNSLSKTNILFPFNISCFSFSLFSVFNR